MDPCPLQVMMKMTMKMIISSKKTCLFEPRSLRAGSGEKSSCPKVSQGRSTVQPLATTP